VNTKSTVALVAAAATLFACKSSHEHAHSAPPAPPANVEEQIALGAKAFGANCARCHGDAGQGSRKAPPLVGPNALPLSPRPDQKVRKVQFHTALDVAQFAVQNMPPDADDRAEISQTEYWAIIAFDLNANGIKPTSIVSPETAGSYVLH